MLELLGRRERNRSWAQPSQMPLKHSHDVVLRLGRAVHRPQRPADTMVDPVWQHDADLATLPTQLLLRHHASTRNPEYAPCHAHATHTRNRYGLRESIRKETPERNC